MAIKLFEGLGKIFVSMIRSIFSIDFLFGAGLTLGTRLFRFYGLIAFISTFIIAIKVGIENHSVWVGILELIKTVIGVDQYIYNLSVEYNSLLRPTLWQSFTTMFLIFKKSFFYIWWYKIIRKIVMATGYGKLDAVGGKSASDWQVFKRVFFILYIFLIISNIIYMVFITGQIKFELIQGQGERGIKSIKYILSNMYVIIDTLFKNWWHFFIAFKGIMHYIITGAMLRSIKHFMGTEVTLNKTIENLTNVTFK